MASTGTPGKSNERVEAQIERSREDGNWSRVLELATHLPSDQKPLIEFLLGEAKLELVLDSDKDNRSSSMLKEAKNHLESCLEKTTGELCMDANLLLSKAHYISGDYNLALKCIKDSGIEAVTRVEKELPLRITRLVAESFAIKGMCLDKKIPQESAHGGDKSWPLEANEYNKSYKIGLDDAVETSDISIDTSGEDKASILIKAADLSIRYLQNMEKKNGSFITYFLGQILETAIQSAPMIYIKNHQMEKGINAYRSAMNAQENASLLNMRQIISRQFAETLLRGVSKSIWPKFDSSLTRIDGPWKPIRHYVPETQISLRDSLWIPKDREEEIILLLMISESLAARNVVLDRSSEFNDTRNQSLQSVISVYDLMSLTFVPLKFYYSDNFERAMKYSFQVKHIWMQFSLTLIQSKKNPIRALRILEEVCRFDHKDPLPPLLAAKICIEDLDKPLLAKILAEDSLHRCPQNDLLYSKVCLVLGISNAMIYESGTDSLRTLKKDHLVDAIKYFKISAESNLYQDNLPYFHLSLLMAHQRSLNDALEYAQIALTMNPGHLPTIQLLILILTGLKQHNAALDLCQAALQEFPDHLILLYIKAHLEEEVLENGREVALMTAKNMLRCWKSMNDLPNYKSSIYCKTSFLAGSSNYDNQSIKMEQTLGEVTSMDSEGWTRVMTSGNNTAVNNIYNAVTGDGTVSIVSSNSSSASNKQMWSIQLHIWLMIVELYIKLDQLQDAEHCIHEGINVIFGPLSHQLMFVKGFLRKSKGNLIEAKAFLQNAISINPKHAKALQQLGHVYYLLGNLMAADKYLKDSLKVDSTLHETWSYMGLVCNAMGDSNRSKDCQKTGLQLESTSPILPFSIISRSVFD